MKIKFERSRRAVKAFLDTPNPEDEFLLVQFSDRPVLSVPLSSDAGQIETSLTATPPKGRTALLDAVYLALKQIRKSNTSGKALLIVSDGGDNYSRHGARELERLVLDSDALTYVIGIYDPLDARSTPEESGGPSLLSWIAEQTGGREYSAEDGNLSAVACKNRPRTAQSVRSRLFAHRPPARGTVSQRPGQNGSNRWLSATGGLLASRLF